MNKGNSVIFLLLFLVIFGQDNLLQAQDKPFNFQFINGNWFDGKSFKKQTFYSVGGILTKKKPLKVDRIINLENEFVIPPFGDSHTHSFDSSFSLNQQAQNALRDGVFYAKVLNNFRSGAERVKTKINNPRSIDVQYSHGGLTGNYSHPIEVYESLTLGIYSFEQQLANAEKIWQSRKAENDAYYIIENLNDLEKKWQMILAGKPDFIKVFLRNSELYEKRRSFVPQEWHRFDGGLDPKIVPIIVQKAHQAGLRVSVANNSAQDFETTVRANADEVSHLPCYQLIDENEKCDLSEEIVRLAAQQGMFITLVTSEYEKERDPNIVRFDKQNLTLLKKYRVKLTLGSNAYGRTPLNGAIAMSKKGLFTNLELLKIWTENTPLTIFPKRKIGKLQEGYEASFITLTENPLQNFEAVRKITFRFKQGFLLQIK